MWDSKKTCFRGCEEKHNLIVPYPTRQVWCQSKSPSTERNTILCACREGLPNGPTGPRPKGPWAQEGPKPEPLREVAVINFACCQLFLDLVFCLYQRWLKCISYLWLKPVYFVNLLLALIECTCAVLENVYVRCKSCWGTGEFSYCAVENKCHYILVDFFLGPFTRPGPGAHGFIIRPCM